RAGGKSSTAQQALAQIGIGSDINGGPSHGERAIDDSLIGGCRNTVRRELWLMVDRPQRVDANRRLNGRLCQRDIPHISRATTALLCLTQVWKDTAKRLGVAAVEGR